VDATRLDLALVDGCAAHWRPGGWFTIQRSADRRRHRTRLAVPSLSWAYVEWALDPIDSSFPRRARSKRSRAAGRSTMLIPGWIVLRPPVASTGGRMIQLVVLSGTSASDAGGEFAIGVSDDKKNLSMTHAERLVPPSAARSENRSPAGRGGARGMRHESWASGRVPPTMGRECPDCGAALTVSVEHVTVLTDKPPIAAPRWDCPNCGWSLVFSPGGSRPEP